MQPQWAASQGTSRPRIQETEMQREREAEGVSALSENEVPSTAVIGAGLKVPEGFLQENKLRK